MTNGPGGSSGSGGGSDGKRRRPQPPVLDLKPTSVTVEPPPDRTPAAADETPPSAQSPDPEPPPAAVSGAPGGEPVASAQPPQAAEAGAVPGSDAAAPDPNAAAPGSVEPPTADPVPEPAVEAEPAPAQPEAEAAPVRSDRPPPETPSESNRRIAGFALAAGAGAAAGALALMLVAWLLGIPLGDDPRVAQSAARIAALETQVRELAARPLAKPDERVDALAGRVEAGEQALARVEALGSRLAAAEAAIKQQTAAAGDAQAGARIAAVEETTKSLNAALADLRRRLEEAGGQPAGAAVASPQEIEALGKRIAALEESAKAVQAALAKPAPPDRDAAARLAAATLALRAAVESGAPYAAELATVKALAPGDARLAALEAYAAEGLPNSATLARELVAAIPKAAPAPETPRTETSWTERLQTGFARLVRVRPAEDAAPANGAYAPVQAALARGDVAGAASAAAALPEPQRAPLEAWIKRAQGHEAALAGARDLARDSITKLSAAQSEPARQ
jgi:hypothetical protein